MRMQRHLAACCLSFDESPSAPVEKMLLEALRTEVFEANLELVRRGLVLYTFGNASGVDRAQGLVVIKPSGVPYDRMTPADMVVTNLEGKVVEGTLRPSSDMPTHVALYRAFPTIGGVVHTHSRHATAWAQAGCEIPCFGTTHADYFHGPVPVTPPLTQEEIEGEYEWNTGEAIIRCFSGVDPLRFPGVLVAGHAPFCWGQTVTQAAHNAVVLEEIAALAYETLTIKSNREAIPDSLRDKHFLRKHGPGAYYGQK
jgi:L-ribulose-5-phosphate 4-epimerase